MAPRPVFADHLVRISSRRTPFFYAYLGLWLHAMAGTILLLPYMLLPTAEAVAVLLLSSLCFGLVIYALGKRQFSLLINLIAYVLSLRYALEGEGAAFILVLYAALVVFASTYFLLGQEYRQYTQTDNAPLGNSLPWWAQGLGGSLLLVFLIYGIDTLVH